MSRKTGPRELACPVCGERFDSRGLHGHMLKHGLRGDGSPAILSPGEQRFGARIAEQHAAKAERTRIEQLVDEVVAAHDTVEAATAALRRVLPRTLQVPPVQENEQVVHRRFGEIPDAVHRLYGASR